MKKYITLLVLTVVLLIVGVRVFNHIHAWLGIIISLCAIYPFYKFIKLLKDEAEN